MRPGYLILIFIGLVMRARASELRFVIPYGTCFNEVCQASDELGKLDQKTSLFSAMQTSDTLLFASNAYLSSNRYIGLKSRAGSWYWQEYQRSKSIPELYRARIYFASALAEVAHQFPMDRRSLSGLSLRQISVRREQNAFIQAHQSEALIGLRIVIREFERRRIAFDQATAAKIAQEELDRSAAKKDVRVAPYDQELAGWLERNSGPE